MSSRAILKEKSGMREPRKISKASAPGPKSRKAIHRVTTAEADRIHTPPEIKLSTTETWLFDPKTFWNHFRTNLSNEAVFQLVSHLSQHATQELEKAAVVPKSNAIPRNYMAWSGQLADDDPNDFAYPALFHFMEKVYKARIYVSQFPLMNFLLSNNLPIRMGFAKGNYNDANIQNFLDLEETRKWDESLMASTKALAITNGRVQAVQSCVQAAQKTIDMLKYQAEGREDRNQDEPMDEEDEDGQEEALKVVNSRLRKALASIVVTLVKKGVVSRNFQKFVFDAADEKPFDMSYLEAKDREFLVLDTQIVRSRNINGKLTFQLNNLSD